MRYEDMQIELEAGRPITITPHGNSMVPMIRSGQQVVITPGVEIKVGDAVLAKVHGRYMLHKVHKIAGGLYQIGNNRGRINGWTSKVFGKVTKIG